VRGEIRARVGVPRAEVQLVGRFRVWAVLDEVQTLGDTHGRGVGLQGGNDGAAVETHGVAVWKRTLVINRLGLAAAGGPRVRRIVEADGAVLPGYQGFCR